MSHNSATKAPALPDRYDAIAEIGRGGMGSVWRVRDLSLSRQLAVKVMLPRAAEHAVDRNRFLQEAQITGRLQHPGIPPVVECGALADDLPYFSMKLVEGRTFGALLEQRREALEDLPHLLGIFEQVCQAVGYAHSCGIIHRDLKPANIMVGAFGEVQVMDWGMAKHISKPSVAGASPPPDSVKPADEETRPRSTDTADENPATIDWRSPAPYNDESAEHSSEPVTEIGRPASARNSTANTPAQTQAGTVMGTPAYMPPEQARGQVDRLDSRADVFSLGVILHEMLTGDRVYSGKNVLKQAAEGDLAHVARRLESCQADQELVQLCGQCLAVNPADRPADGSVVAEAIRVYDEGVQLRLQHEQTNRAAAEARTEEEQKRAGLERAKRRVTLALAGVIVLLTVGGAAGLVWYRQEQIAKEATDAIRAEQAAGDIESGLGRAAELRDDFRFTAAESLLSQAERRLSAVPVSTNWRDKVSEATKDLRTVRTLDDIRLRRATWTDDGFDKKFSIGAEGAYAEAFRELDVNILGAESANDVANRITRSSVASALIAALDQWAIDDTENADRILAVARAADRDSLRNQIRDPEIWADKSQLLLLAETIEPAELPPGTLSHLAYRLASVGEAAAAADLLTNAAMERPDDFWLRFQSAEVLEGLLDRPDEALGHLYAAIAIRPDNAAAHNQLGGVLHKIGRSEEAMKTLRRAAEVDPGHALARSNLGRILHEQGQLDAAIAAYQEAAKADPNFADAHNNLGLMFSEVGKQAESEAAYRRAIEIDSMSAMAHSNLGLLLHETGRLLEAQDAHQQAIAADKHYALGHYNFALLLQETGTVAEAESEYRLAIQADPKLAEAYCNLGNLLFNETDRFDESVKLLEKGHEFGSAKKKWTYPSEQWLANARRGLAMDKQLTTIREGAAIPTDTREILMLAELALTRKRHPRVALKLYSAGLSNSGIPPRIRLQFQYNAACAALLCAAGKVETGAESPGQEEAKQMRKQAYEWLHSNLAEWKGFLASSPEAREASLAALQHWLVDSDLATVRETKSLADLAEQEREEWQEFWRNVKQALEEDGSTGDGKP